LVVQVDDTETGRGDWVGRIRDVVGVFVAASGSFGGIRRETVGVGGAGLSVLPNRHAASYPPSNVL
jgi:hypothetical protein